jgi:outer membrane receptor protein involved in Fe transport
VRTIDPGTIERVEIIKGAAAEGLYGAGAEGGVIHIYTKEAAGRPTPR